MEPVGFVAEEYAAAFVPPTLTIGGRTYVGVLVSADTWWAIEPRINRLRGSDATRQELGVLVRDMTNLSFPRPWWQFWRPRVWTLLRRLPWAAQLEAAASFMVAQALAQLGTPGRTTETNGTGSDA